MLSETKINWYCHIPAKLHKADPSLFELTDMSPIISSLYIQGMILLELFFQVPNITQLYYPVLFLYFLAVFLTFAYFYIFVAKMSDPKTLWNTTFSIYKDQDDQLVNHKILEMTVFPCSDHLNVFSIATRLSITRLNILDWYQPN